MVVTNCYNLFEKKVGVSMHCSVYYIVRLIDYLNKTKRSFYELKR